MGMGAAIAGATLGAGVIGAVASTSAANTQANAAKSIANQQLAAGQTASAAMNPYVAQGQTSLDNLNANMNYLTTPYAPTQAQLAATPGYQFTLGQGLQSTQNAAAAKGLGISGAALKGAASYATGLAQNTYAQNAGIYQQNQQQIGNILTSQAANGQNAAAAQAGIQTGQANAAGQTQMAGATAAASGITGAASQLTNGLTSATSALYQNSLINNIIAQNTANGLATNVPAFGKF